MENKIEYCFVVDKNNKPLAPTKVNKGWYLIRKGKAELKNKYPVVIRLLKEVKIDKDESRMVCGIDDGSLHVGIAIVQKCSNKNKVIFKGTIEQRKDVKHLVDVRREYRRYHRYHKRFRQVRFNNRVSSKRENRIAPTIKQKKDAILRTLYWLNRWWLNIQEYHLEDVCIDIRAMTDGYKPYGWQYQKSNRLDENLRKATIFRDGCKCQECGKTGCVLEVHHIRARRYGGADTIGNLITLCSRCHQKTEGKEHDFEEKYFSMINSKPQRFDYAMHVMQGKHYLRKKISEMGSLHLTNGGDTANKRILLNIEKSHCNDAICVTNCIPDTCNVKEWMIKPMRRKSKAKTDDVLGIKHRDLVSYKCKNGDYYKGYVTALYPKLNLLNFQSKTKHFKKVSANKCHLLWKYNKIYWLECA